MLGPNDLSQASRSSIYRSHVEVLGMSITNGHAGGNGMGINDEVGHNAICSPGHVLLRVGDADCPLLPMSACKLVANLWYTNGPHLVHCRSKYQQCT